MLGLVAVAERRVLQGELLLRLKGIGSGGHNVGNGSGQGGLYSDRGGIVVVVMLLISLYLTRHLGQGFQWRPDLILIVSLNGGLIYGETRVRAKTAIEIRSHVGAGVQEPVIFGPARCAIDAVQGQAGIDAIGLGYGGTFLGEVVGEAVDAALGEVLAAGLAAVVVAIAVVVELRASLKELENQRIGPPTHLVAAPGPYASVKQQKGRK